MSFIEKYLIEPFRYATSGWSKVLVGILLLFFITVINMVLPTLLGPFAFIFTFGIDLIVGIILSGYYIEVIRNTLKEVDALPNWSNFIEVIKDGIFYNIALFIGILIACMPAILPMLVGALFTVVRFGDYLTSLLGSCLPHDDPWTAIASLSIVVVLMLFYIVIIFIAFMLYTPLATVNFAKKGFLGFFEFFYILKKVSLEYILILLLYIMLGIILGIIFNIMVDIFLFIFFIIPPLGMLILLFIILIVDIIVFILFIMFNRAITKYYLEREREQCKNKTLT